MKAMEVITVVGALIGALFVLSALSSSISAPQGAEAAAIGLGFAVIPYCVTAMLQRREMLRLATEAAERRSEA